MSSYERNLVIVNVFPIVWYYNYNHQKETVDDYQVYNLWISLHLSMLSDTYNKISNTLIIPSCTKLYTYFINITTIIDDNRYNELKESNYFIFQDLKYNEVNDEMLKTYKFPYGHQVVANTGSNIKTFISSNDGLREVHLIYKPTITKLELLKFDNLEEHCKQFINNYKPINNYPIFGKLYPIIP